MAFSSQEEQPGERVPAPSPRGALAALGVPVCDHRPRAGFYTPAGPSPVSPCVITGPELGFTPRFYPSPPALALPPSAARGRRALIPSGSLPSLGLAGGFHQTGFPKDGNPPALVPRVPSSAGDSLPLVCSVPARQTPPHLCPGLLLLGSVCPGAGGRGDAGPAQQEPDILWFVQLSLSPAAKRLQMSFIGTTARGCPL